VDLISLAIITGGLLLYLLISGRLQGTILTDPLIFVIFGFVVGGGGLSVATVDAGHSTIHIIAEFTLILVLFTDAARMGVCEESQDVTALPLREGYASNDRERLSGKSGNA
jgi:hypothetical protein